VTADQRILKAASRLREEQRVEVLSDADAVALVRERIALRDQRAQDFASKAGTAPPEWVGSD